MPEQHSVTECRCRNYVGLILIRLTKYCTSMNMFFFSIKHTNDFADVNPENSDEEGGECTILIMGWGWGVKV